MDLFILHRNSLVQKINSFSGKMSLIIFDMVSKVVGVPIQMTEGKYSRQYLERLWKKIQNNFIVRKTCLLKFSNPKMKLRKLKLLF